MINPAGMGSGFRPPIILLRDGTDTSQGRAQVLSNISACLAVVDILRTTLGPRGMDKLIHTESSVTISNDGAEIMQLLQVVHPAAKTLVDIARSQDAEVGDGTTTVVLLAGELLRNAREFVEEGVHPQIIVRGYRHALKVAKAHLESLALGIDSPEAKAAAAADSAERLRVRATEGGAAAGGGEGGSASGASGVELTPRRVMLEKCAKTALNSKLIARYQDFFAPMVVDAIEAVSESLDLSLVGVKKVPGGSVTESFLVDGVAFKRTFSYAGFEQQPKSFEHPKLLLLNLELELKSERENAEIRIDDPEKYQSIVDAEWDIIYEKLRLCAESGAQVILSKLPIGDLATQYFADRKIFCAGRVPNEDLVRVARATGARVQTTVHGLTGEELGTCGAFEEKQIGAERFNIFTGCPHARTATMVLRGGAEQFIAESARSIHDSLMIVKNAVRSSRVVAGGGAVEMDVSAALRDDARGIKGKEQLIVRAFARALEVIPRQIADNAGFDSTDILNRLRMQHAKPDGEGKWMGVDIEEEGVCDTLVRGVWEPVASKLNSFAAATEAACLILSVDETVRNPRSQGDGTSAPGMGGMAGRGMGGRGIGRGKPMSAAMGGGGMRSMVGGARGVRQYRGRGGH